MFSLEQSLAILGDPAIGDRLELIAFNALPGAFTDDMWAHQYNQQPNQVEVSLHRKPWTTDGPESNIYGLEPNFGCCTANFHQGWPKFTASLWMATYDDGLAATAYSPCDLRTVVQDTPITISEETEYPFRDLVRISVNPEKAVTFPLRLRVPGWVGRGASLSVNGQPQTAPVAGSFAELRRTWRPGDRVELRLPMTPIATRGYNNSLSISRGALLFSYPIGEDWVKLRDRERASDWQIFPNSQWNYGLAVDERAIAGLHVEESPIGTVPFGLKGTAVNIRVDARKLPTWRAIDGVAEPIPESPAASNQADEQITLVPYAAAKLRITAFPELGS
jgi:hypothetical protein